MEKDVQLDIDELLSTSQQTIKYLENSSWGAQKPVELLSALHDYTSQYIAEGVDLSDIRVTAGEWAAMVRADQMESDTARKFVATHLKKLKDYLEENREEVDGKLRQANSTHRLIIEKTASQGQHKVYYYLGLEEIESEAGEDQELEPIRHAKNVLRYKISKIEQPVFWARPLLKFDLEGINLWLIGGIPSIVLVGMFLWLVAIVNLESFWQLSLYIPAAVAFYMTWLMVRPFYHAIDRRVAIAPIWLIRLRMTSAQLDYRATEKFRASGRPVRQLRIVCYQGSCPICGALVNVGNGSSEFKGRLVGRCSEAPEEHLYSFDHVTKMGIPLRSSSEYGSLH